MSGRSVPALGDWRKQETITADEWCAIARTSRFTVYRHLKDKLIPGFQVGDSWRIPVRWARMQLGEIEAEAETEEPAPPVVPPVVRKRGRPRKADAQPDARPAGGEA
jgi:hypothetical protein